MRGWFDRLRGGAGRGLMVAALALGLVACAATSPKSVAQFKTGLSAVQTDSMTLLMEFNKFTRELALDRAATLPNLREEDVAPGLDADSLARWNAALEALSLYASSLQSLSEPSGGTAVEGSLKALGERIIALQLPDAKETPKADALNAAVGHIGRLVVEAAARRRALEVARDADPAVRETLMAMADMVGGDALHGGLRTTLWASWSQRAAMAQAAFLQPGADKRAAAAQFADAFEGRQAGDAALGAVHQALLDLADLHTALSQGRTADAAEIIAALRQEVALAKGLLVAARGGKPAGGTP